MYISSDEFMMSGLAGSVSGPLAYVVLLWLVALLK